MSDGVENENDLLEKAVGGDAVALTVLLTRVHETLRAQVARRIPPALRSVIDAEDVLQIGYTRVFRKVHQFVPAGKSSFDRWTSTIVLRQLRTVIAEHRAAKRGGGRAQERGDQRFAESATALLYHIEATGRTPSRSVATHEAVRQMQDALALLPPDQAQAVRLVYLEGCCVEDAARELGRTDRAVHNLCFKAKNRLRELLAAQHGTSFGAPA